MRVILTPLASSGTLALLFLPKKGQLIIEAKGSHTFTIVHYKCLHSVFSKNMNTPVMYSK